MPKLKYNLDEIQSFTIEPGKYRARLMKCEQTLSQKKQPMLTWSWKLVSGAEKGKETRSFTSLQENALFGLKEHLEAFGYTGTVHVDTNKLVGKYVVLVIGLRTGISRTGEEREMSSVMGIFPDRKTAPEPEEEEDYEDDAPEEDDDDDADDDYDDDPEDDDDPEEDDDYEEPEPAPRRKAPAPKPKPKSSRAQERRQAPSRQAPPARRKRNSDEIPF